MANNRAQQRIKQTRGILIIVVLACASKLVKTIIDGNPQTAQIVILAVVIAVLVVVLLFYSWIDRYTKKEQATYGQPGSLSEKLYHSDKPVDPKTNHNNNTDKK